MPGLNGHTITLRLANNIRVAKYAVLVTDPTDTTQQFWYCQQPVAKASAPWLVAPAGVAIQNLVEPNYFPGQDPDPATVTGSTPTLPYVLGGTGAQQPGPGITLQYTGLARVQADGSGTIQDGDIVVVADQYGRVNTPANLAIVGGTYAFQVGIARGKATAINQVLWADLIMCRFIA